jgi:hypothetical protein
MPRTKQPTTAPRGFALGRDIDISKWHIGELVGDPEGRIRCILGYQREEQPFDLPWYSPSVALHDRDGRSSFRFVELRRGIVERCGLLNDSGYFKLIDDRYLNLPRGASSYFGVTTRGGGEQDDDATRQVFGATMGEFTAAARAVAAVVGRDFPEMLQLPRLTFSKTRSNSCDVTGCLIPKDFPYLAFDEAQYHWSHVSLFGFYRLLSFMCPNEQGSPVARALLGAGLPAELLARLREHGMSYSIPLYPDRRHF